MKFHWSYCCLWFLLLLGAGSLLLLIHLQELSDTLQLQQTPGRELDKSDVLLTGAEMAHDRQRRVFKSPIKYKSWSLVSLLMKEILGRVGDE
ncbi:hypothetical protein DPEC_G00163390 [Dallia pectoralis]|uniref:Uncharacterized protein n=1 Tax=Dallia pectoralis TaxID=75939 RepID=A0ACC2GGK3_DALPE|nr:hypothetical protein DPEC_G00163390 [Dallia pectoralis]